MPLPRAHRSSTNPHTSNPPTSHDHAASCLVPAPRPQVVYHAGLFACIFWCVAFLAPQRDRQQRTPEHAPHVSGGWGSCCMLGDVNFRAAVLSIVPASLADSSFPLHHCCCCLTSQHPFAFPPSQNTHTHTHYTALPDDAHNKQGPDWRAGPQAGLPVSSGCGHAAQPLML